MKANAKVLIAGSGRSGTTWVQDSLAAANDMRTLFEPLHPIGVRNASTYAYQYFSRYATNIELKTFMSDVLSGEMKSIWANYRIRPDRFNVFRHGLKDPYFYLKKFYRHYNKYNSQGRNGLIIKCIRANLMLPWIMENFDIRTVLIIRHPCAVASSSLKLPQADWSAEKLINRYRNIPAIAELIRNEFGVDFNTRMSTASAIACVWCIENMLPIRWAPESGYAVVAYEDLLVDDGKQWDRLTRNLGLDNTPDTSIREKPSQQVSLEMRGKNITTRHIDRWKQQLDSQSILDISRTLKTFNCEYYSVESGMPCVEFQKTVETAQ